MYIAPWGTYRLAKSDLELVNNKLKCSGMATLSKVMQGEQFFTFIN